MDWSVPEHLAPRLAALRQLVAGQVAALETTAFGQGFASVEPHLLALRAHARDLGLFVPHLPRAWGGSDLTLPELALVGEVLGWSPLGHYVCNCQAPDAGNMELLLRHGSPEQHERWLAPLARGEMRSCFGMTEPGRSGANPVWLQTTAHRDGADYVLDGHKWFASSADGAAFCIVMAVTDATAAVHGRASMLLVPTDTPGFQLVRNLPVMGEAGTGWMSHGELRLDGVRVPASHRIGAEGAGFALAQERLGPGRIHHCMRWIGICERAFDLMCRRAATRELAPGDMLGSRQLVQAWVAESRAEIDAARLLVLHAAWRIQRDGAAAARDEISLVKFHVAAVLQAVLDRAIQTHGAAGLLDDTPLAFWWRHERGARIYDGPDEVHKTTVARRILATYAPPPVTAAADAATVTAADRAGPVRDGEELPAAGLAAWLDAQGLGPAATAGGAAPAAAVDAATLAVEQFPGGHSNLTYLLRYGGRQLVLRRPPFGAAIRTAHDMGREFHVLSRLHAHYPKAPQALAACDDVTVIGAPFYVMQRVHGPILRQPRLPRGLDLGPPQLRGLSEAVVDALIELHAVDPAAAGLADLGRPAGYTARQVSGWTERWHRAATEPVADVERAAAWLAEHQPRRTPAAEETAATLLHNDFKYDNLVLTADCRGVVAVLDWEMATVGEPLLDLGSALAYWLDPDDHEARQRLPVGPTALPGNLSRREVVERYVRGTGRDAADILFYYVFGLLKVAVIAQQIYHRYARGLTRDERFASLAEGVRLLGRTATQALSRRRIDRLWD